MRWKRLAVGVAAAAMLAGLLVVVPSIVTPSKAPQAAAHGSQGENGCTAPWQGGPGFSFHDACDAHDRDYINRPHGVNEWGRSVADLTFLYRMQDVCRAMAPGWQQTNCYSLARQYYNGVRTFGFPFYYHWSKWVRANVRLYIV